MILLDTSSKSLEVVLAAAESTNHLPITVSFIDQAAQGANAYDTQTNGTSAVTIVPAPNPQPVRASTRRVVAISIYNEDTGTVKVTVRLNNNTVLRKIYSVYLNPGDALFYDEEGWYVLDAYGNTKTISVTIIDDEMTYVPMSGTNTCTATIVGLTAMAAILNKNIGVIASNANTGACTLDLGFGAYPFRKFGNTAMEANDFKTNQRIMAAFDGTYFQVVTPTDNIGEGN